MTKEVLLPLGSSIYSNGDKSCTVKLLFSSQFPDSRLLTLVKVRDNSAYNLPTAILYIIGFFSDILVKYVSVIIYSVINSTCLWQNHPMLLYIFYVNDLHIDNMKIYLILYKNQESQVFYCCRESSTNMLCCICYLDFVLATTNFINFSSSHHIIFILVRPACSKNFFISSSENLLEISIGINSHCFLEIGIHRPPQ